MSNDNKCVRFHYKGEKMVSSFPRQPTPRLVIPDKVPVMCPDDVLCNSWNARNGCMKGCLGAWLALYFTNMVPTSRDTDYRRFLTFLRQSKSMHYKILWLELARTLKRTQHLDLNDLDSFNFLYDIPYLNDCFFGVPNYKRSLCGIWNRSIKEMGYVDDSWIEEVV